MAEEFSTEWDFAPQGGHSSSPMSSHQGPFSPCHTRLIGSESSMHLSHERIEEIAVGERCGITVPTRTSYDGAGYLKLFKEMKIPFYCFEEEMQVEIPLEHPERLRDYVYTPEPVAKADFFVNCPKFKAHPWTTVTFGLKNYIGIQDDRHRLIDHDHKLNEKVADLQHIVQPQFIAIDGIVAGEGRMLTPEPYDLKLTAFGNNSIAFDAVCCHIIGIDPSPWTISGWHMSKASGPSIWKISRSRGI